MGTNAISDDAARSGGATDGRQGADGAQSERADGRPEKGIGATLARLVRWRRRPAPVKIYVDSIRI